jgi:SAM-dependent methyltransferase
LPANPNARVLEIGCGNGDTGAYALAERKCAVFCGVELCERAALLARRQITEVLIGDVERMDLPWPEESFDAMIISEVLEHLVDPWAALRKLALLLRPGATIFASSPNVAHHSVIRMLLHGRWDLADKGIMDRTHLRWFTFQSYRAMFESAGFVVDRVGPLAPLGPKGRLINALTFGRYTHLFAQQVNLKAHKGLRGIANAT